MIRYKHIEIEWNIGSIHGLTNDAIKVAQAHDCKVTFPFNGIKITVDNNEVAEPSKLKFCIDKTEEHDKIVLDVHEVDELQTETDNIVIVK